ncbi:MAG: hypothetical protein CSB16_01685 [Clostridiales bacterium]|nr:MAG: hypothetical protein CSB16_01685 [Clostridiales bacterium]
MLKKNMSVLLVMVLVVTSIFSLFHLSFAKGGYGGTLGDVGYSYNGETKVLKFGGGTFPDVIPSNWDEDFREEVTKITFEREITAGNSLEELFAFYSSLESIVNFDEIDTSNVTDMSRMFIGCRSLNYVNLSNFDTSNVTDMRSMFYDCESLTSLDVSSFDTSNVTDMGSMFEECESLESLDLSNFHIGSDIYKEDIFDSMINLRKLTLGPNIESLSGSALLDIQEMNGFDSEKYTGKWQSVGSGTVISPKGDQVLTSEELVNTYDGSHPDTYVWQPERFKLGIRFDLNGGSAPAGNPNAFDDTTTTGSYAYYEDIPASEFKPLLDVEPVKDGDLFSHWSSEMYDSDDYLVYDSETDPWDKEYGLSFFEPDKESYIVFTAQYGKIERLSGKTRYETAVEVSKKMHTSSLDVIIVNGRQYPDALAATPLAGLYDAPILLVQKNRIPASTKDEIERLGATKAYIVGGKGVVSESVASELEGMGLTLERYSGKDRYKTALAVAKKIVKISDGGNLILAKGTDFPDALTVTSLAIKEGIPILLTNPKTLDDDVLDFMMKSHPRKIYIAGGKGAVSLEIQNSIENLGISVKRFGGKDRYETGKKIAEYTYPKPDKIIFANGRDFADAMVGGPLSRTHIIGGPVMLVGKNHIPQATKDYMTPSVLNKVNKVYIVGGKGVISEYFEHYLIEYLDK